MIVFSFDDYKASGTGVLESGDNTSGDFEILHFGNGELYCQVTTNVKGQECVIVSSFTAGHELEPLMLSHTLKHLGATRVTLIAPYLGYMRQDKEESKRGLGSQWIGAMLKASGVDNLITIDLHSEMSRKLLDIPVVSLASAPVFSEALRPFISDDVTILAPDQGALEKAKMLEESFAIKVPVTYFNKVRTPEGVTITTKENVSDRVIIVDDILDTGGTLVAACTVLKDQGVKDIVICVTHGQFVGEKWKELASLRVSKIYVTDSLPKIPRHELITVVPLAWVFQQNKL